LHDADRRKSAFAILGKWRYGEWNMAALLANHATP
jgi:hypothetical protein